MFQILVYFLCKTATPLKKVIPSFPATLFKYQDPAKPPFWKFGRRLNPLPRLRLKGGVSCMDSPTGFSNIYAFQFYN